LLIYIMFNFFLRSNNCQYLDGIGLLLIAMYHSLVMKLSILLASISIKIASNTFYYYCNPPNWKTHHLRMSTKTWQELLLFIGLIINLNNNVGKLVVGYLLKRMKQLVLSMLLILINNYHINLSCSQLLKSSISIQILHLFSITINLLQLNMQ
jgi:hypothetical protein